MADRTIAKSNEIDTTSATSGFPSVGATHAVAPTNVANTQRVTLPNVGGSSKAQAAAELVAQSNLDHHVIPDAELLQYPWSCIGRLEATPKANTNWQLAGSAVLVGPNMLLTASHIFTVRPTSGWMFRFYPAYKGQPQTTDPAGGTHTSAFLTGRMITGKPNGDHANENQVVGWDFVICELDTALGDRWGHLGVISGSASFYSSHRWTSVGYPQGLGGKNPIRFPGIDISDVDDDSYGTKEIETDDYNFDTFFPGGHTFAPGWSGGPLLGNVDNAWWVAGVMSGREPDGVFDVIDGVNVFAGGQRLLDIYKQAYKDWFPTRAILPAWAHIAAVSRSLDAIDLFATDVDGQIRTASWSPAFAKGWHGWNAVNNGLAAAGMPLHALSRSTDVLDVFVVANGIVCTASWEPGAPEGWRGWWDILGGQSPGGRITGVSRRKDTLDVFVAGADGHIYTAAWDPALGNAWRGWWRIGDVKVPHGAYIHAVSRSTDQMDIFVVDVHGKIRTAAWHPSFSDGWRGWWEINGGTAMPGAPVTAVSRRTDHLDLFVVGTDGGVWSAAWAPNSTSSWAGWFPIGNVRVPGWATVNAVSRSTDKLDLFVTDLNGVIRTASWEPAFSDGWHGWHEINGGRALPGAPVTALSRRTDHLDIFVVGTDGRVASAAWAPNAISSWVGWFPIGA